PGRGAAQPGRGTARAGTRQPRHRRGRGSPVRPGRAAPGAGRHAGAPKRAAEHSMQAVELAREHGWTDEPTAGIAYMILGSVLTWQGRTEEAEPWVQD